MPCTSCLPPKGVNAYSAARNSPKTSARCFTEPFCMQRFEDTLDWHRRRCTDDTSVFALATEILSANGLFGSSGVETNHVMEAFLCVQFVLTVSPPQRRRHFACGGGVDGFPPVGNSGVITKRKPHSGA